jgi:Tfp pilus assembly protein PilZ
MVLTFMLHKGMFVQTDTRYFRNKEMCNIVLEQRIERLKMGDLVISQGCYTPSEMKRKFGVKK